MLSSIPRPPFSSATISIMHLSRERARLFGPIASSRGEPEPTVESDCRKRGGDPSVPPVNIPKLSFISARCIVVNAGDAPGVILIIRFTRHARPFGFLSRPRSSSSAIGEKLNTGCRASTISHAFTVERCAF